MSKRRLTNCEKAKIALQSRLYVSGWMLNILLNSVVDKTLTSAMIFLHYEDGKYVGVAMRYCGEVYVFVKKAYRKKGIGTKLIKRATKSLRDNDQLLGYRGIDGSEYFWQKQDKIEYHEFS